MYYSDASQLLRVVTCLYMQRVSERTWLTFSDVEGYRSVNR